MDKKLEELLNTIKFPEEEYSSFLKVSLKRVKVSKNKMRIILNSEKPMNLNVYLKLNELLNGFFNTDCILEVVTEKKDLENIRECYNYAVSFCKLPLLKDRLKNNYNSYYIEFNNDNELRQCTDDIKKVNDVISLMGYNKLDTMVNEFNRVKIEKQINKDLEVKISPQKSDKKVLTSRILGAIVSKHFRCGSCRPENGKNLPNEGKKFLTRGRPLRYTNQAVALRGRRLECTLKIEQCKKSLCK